MGKKHRARQLDEVKPIEDPDTDGDDEHYQGNLQDPADLSPKRRLEP